MIVAQNRMARLTAGVKAGEAQPGDLLDGAAPDDIAHFAEAAKCDLISLKAEPLAGQPFMPSSKISSILSSQIGEAAKCGPQRPESSCELLECSTVNKQLLLKKSIARLADPAKCHLLHLSSLLHL